MTTAATVVESDAQRAHKLSSAKKKLKRYRASKSTTQSSSSHASSSPSSSPSKSSSGLPLPRRVPNGAALPDLSEAAMEESISQPAKPAASQDAFNFSQSISRPRHNRVGSRALSSHRRQNSSFSWPRQAPTSGTSEQVNRPSVMGLFDVPPLEHSSEQTDEGTEGESEGPCSSADHAKGAPREIVTTPATPPAQAGCLAGSDEDKENNHDDEEEAAINRLSSLSFGSKAPQQMNTRRRPTSFSLRDTTHMSSHSFSAPFVPRRPLSARLMSSSAALPVPLDLSSELSRSTSPQPHRKRHSHNRSESISLPNLKLGGRPTSLRLPSPNFTSASAASSPTIPASTDRRSFAPTTGSRLKFEPSDKEKEESRRRALDKLTEGMTPPTAPASNVSKGEIVLPSFDDDDDDLSTSSSRPQSATCTSAASSSRPSSLTVNSASSSSFGISSPLPWSTFDEADRWTAVSQRFEAKEEPPFSGFSFDLPEPTPRPSSVLLNGGLGVLAEEDETESEEAAEEEDSTHQLEAAPSDMTLSADDSTPSAPTPSRLRQLHLVSSVSSSGRRSSNPDVLQSFSRTLAQSRETPTKSPAGFGSASRSGGRPRPLDTSTDWFGSTPSPSKPRPLSTGSYPRGGGASRTSSISYKKDDSGSGSSRDYGSSRGEDMLSPTSSIDESGSTRSMGRASCPRPRSLILGLTGTSGRVLGEVSEADEDGDDEANTRDSFDSPFWTKRDSRDHIDMELKRDALREDVDLWRKRCKGLEDKYEAERRESAVLRERVRKLGDRLLTVSSAAPSRPSAAEEHEAAQARLIAEMREQLFGLTAALERERKEKAEAVAQAVELQAMLDALHKTPHVSPHQLPSTPKSRQHMASISGAMSTPAEAYEDADIYDDVDTYEYGLEAGAYNQAYGHEENQDPNLIRMRGGWGFPQGPVDKSSRESKRESFFGLSRARPVRPAPSISVPGGLGWGTAQPSPTEPTFDLPPFVVDDSNSSLVTPISPTKAVYTSNGTGRPRPISAIGRPPPSLSSFTHTTHTTYSTHSTHTSQPPAQTTPERQLASSGFGLSFLSGYLSRSTPPQVPLISITPSSVSPKRQLTTLVKQSRSDRQYGSVAPGCDIDFRHSCRRCTGEIIEL
ncbi:hypothetical protein A1Q1_01885 [Trichosporon asahii var. asahii CBS 2479]|uniref:Uncharacterized protein n=1 Tax=Trichosporon asahii var. asahii (strain ATCC 90039 / CBS 2479 / JCM 2466 / KCTC 7840 / NBRC 103889/ NCYC 2677 / UAMH 7654) TaxID=1186058 RepID=J5QTM6_TRIAS|nr:hypothetical protein A1Q1_01885 [Trichosporon asahii var. asahii CBS 2479]EJT49028.1 hypothetical protein A1Q1_01885 [Trichosporon asahii var. asahii CBS 2479]